MATYTINSRKYGPIEFHMPDKGGEVRLKGKITGGVGKQICIGGKFSGSKIYACPDTFVIACMDWHEKFIESLTRAQVS